MDYYYSLLSSYDLLKKRKFKLSLREQPELEPPSSFDTQAEFATPDQIETPSGNTLEVWLSKRGKITLRGPWGKTYRTLDTGSTTDLSDSDLAILKSWWATGGAEGEEGEDEDTPLTTVEPVSPHEGLIPIADNLEDHMLDFFEVEEGIIQESEYFPGYLPNEQHSRLQKIITQARKKAHDEEQGLGIRGAAKEDSTVTEKLLASPNLDPAQAEKALVHGEKTLDLIDKIHRGEHIPNSELRSISEGIEVTPEGVLFDGVYLQYRSEASSKNDLWVNSVEQLNEKIKENNEGCPDEEAETYRECYIEPIPAPEKGGRDLNLANRGLMMERAAVLRDLAEARAAGCDKEGNCPEIDKQIEAEYKEMLQDGTSEEAKQLFLEGLCAGGNACLATIEGADAAIVTEQVVHYLVENEGMSEEAAVLLVQKAANMDDGGTRAMVLLVVSGRGFGNYLEGLDIRGSEVTGTQGSNQKGQKGDVKRTVTRKSFEPWKEDYANSMSPMEKRLDEAANCTGDDRVGIGGLGEDVEGSPELVSFGTEQKARSELGKGRTKMGEGMTSRMTEICAGTDHLPEEEQEFITANTDRIDNCVKAHGKSPWGDNSIHDVACGVQSRVDQRMNTINRTLAGEPIMDDNGEPIADAGITLVDGWLENKKPLKESDEERARLARSGLAKLPRASKEEKEALKKIARELEADAVVKELERDTDKDGVLSGEGLGYILYRQGLEGGSLHENLKDVRGYSDRAQNTGLVSGSTYGAIALALAGEAQVRQSGEGAKTFNLATTEGEELFKSSFERGQDVVSIGNEAMTRVERNIEAHPGREDSSMFMNFLLGQQALLEKLINQTT